jgi:hypothetical protein
VFLALGGLTFVGLSSHFIENQYVVSITPSEGGTWRVLVPRPTVAMSLEITGQTVAVSPTETAYGTMVNITGTGQVNLTYTLQRFEFRLTRFEPNDLDRYIIGLTGQANASSFQVWMESQDVATANVSGIGSWQGIHLGSGMSCVGPAFIGDISLGWNAVPALVPDCLIGIDSIPWLELVAPGLMVVGAVVLVRAYRRAGKSGS